MKCYNFGYNKENEAIYNKESNSSLLAGMEPSINIYYFIEVYWCVVVDVEECQVGQTTFPHRCSHVNN